MRAVLTLLKRWAPLFAVIFLTAGVARSQVYNLYNVDTSEFPLVKANIVARDYIGNDYQNLVASDFTLTENGVDKSLTLQVDCAPSDEYPPLFVNMILDASSSMRDEMPDGKTKFDWVKDGTKAFIDSIRMVPPSAMRLLTFGGVIGRYTPWETTKEPLYTFLDQLNIAQGATNFNVPFFDWGQGCITQMKTRPEGIRRVAIFLTDGKHEKQEEFRYMEIIDSLAKHKVQLYAISIGSSMYQDLGFIAERTGGAKFRVDTRQELIQIYSLIAQEIQSKMACKLIWESDYLCEGDERTREVYSTFGRFEDPEFPLLNEVSMTYEAPDEAVARIEASATDLIFGDPNLGTARREVILTARVADFTISGVNFAPDDGSYAIDWNGKTPPFDILKDQSHTIYIDYQEDPPSASTETIMTLDATPCEPPTFSLVAPCGGTAEDVDFATVPVLSTDVKTASFVNTTAAAIQGSWTLAGADAAEFNITEGNTGTFDLEPAESLDLTLEFTPQTSGPKTAQIEYEIDICGTVVQMIDGVGADTDFPMPTQNWQKKRVLTVNAEQYEIQNSGGQAVTVNSIALRNDDGSFEADFPTVPFTIAVGSSETFEVRFIPPTEGVFQDYIDLTLEGNADTFTGNLVGEGVIPEFSAEEVIFPATNVGETAPAQNLTITNEGSMELYVEEIRFKNASPNFAFATGATLTDITIPIGGSHDVGIEFTPQSSGSLSAIVEVVHDGVPGPNVTNETSEVDVTGIGVGLDIDPLAIDFGQVLTCNAQPATITIDNTTGATPIDVTDGTLDDDVNFSFNINDGSIAAGETGTVTVYFNPATAGAHSGTLTLTTSAGPAAIALQGEGTIIETKIEFDPITLPKENLVPGALIPFTWRVSLPEVDAGYTELRFTFEHYDKMLLYDDQSSITANTTNWNWQVQPAGDNSGLDIIGTGNTNSAVDVEITLTMRAYLSDLATREVRAELEDIPGAPCVIVESDTLDLTVWTCNTNGRLIEINRENYALKSVDPNPAGSIATAKFSLGLEAPTKLELYNYYGELVEVIVDKTMKNGVYEQPINVSDMSSGIYYLKLTSGHFTDTKKLVIVK